jgi:UDP:flavonoid glycosyltransferase YjiC (YdhE family)
VIVAIIIILAAVLDVLVFTFIFVADILGASLVISAFAVILAAVLDGRVDACIRALPFLADISSARIVIFTIMVILAAVHDWSVDAYSLPFIFLNVAGILGAMFVIITIRGVVAFVLAAASVF